MATPFLLISNNDISSDRNNPSQPEPQQPDPNPTRPKSRKVTKSGPSGSGGPKKQPQRGMGVAQLERLLRQQQNQQAQVGFQQQLIPAQLHQCPFHQANPLAGVPVSGPVQPNRLAHYGLPVHRAGPLDADHGYPRMALGYPGRVGQEFNTFPFLDPSFKKKRVMVDDLGFMSGSNFGGYEMNLINNGDNSHYLPINGGTSEVVAIHKKGDGSNMMMMKEYGFFPDKSEAKEGNNLSLCIGNTNNTNTNTKIATNYISSNNNNFNDNYNNQYYNNNNNNNNEMDNYMLSLKMGSSDRDHSSSSSISTLSPPPNNNGLLDLSLRL